MPSVVIVHDYLTQRGGAERVVLAMLACFPGARLLTSVYEPESTFPEFARHDVETMGLQRVAAFRKDPRLALPLLARAFSRHTVGDADAVLISTSGWAHGVGATVPRVVYCHNPARWLYQTRDYLGGAPAQAQRAFSLATRPLRRWDTGQADRASIYFANSTSVRGRIADTYGIDAALLHPPVSIEPEGTQEPVRGIEPGFLLTVGRRRGYKNTEIICEAVAGIPDARLVAVGGLPDPPPGGWPDRLTGVTGVSDAQLRWLYAHASAVVAVSLEDFGLTPVEGYAFGTPAVVLGAGGYLDSGDALSSTVFVDRPSVDSLREGLVRAAERSWDADAIRAHAGGFSLDRFGARLHEAVDSVGAAPRSTRRMGGSGPVPGVGDRRAPRATTERGGEDG